MFGKPPEARGATHARSKERPAREGVERTLKQGQVGKSERSDRFTATMLIATILILIVGVKKVTPVILYGSRYTNKLFFKKL